MTQTANFNLYKFTAGASNWGDAMNSNLDIIDAAIHNVQTGPAAPYTFVQSSPLAVWVIKHNLGFYPHVAVIDSSGSLVVGGVQYDSLNQVTLTFSGAFSGTAVLA